MSGEALRFLHPDWLAPSNVRALVTTRAGGASAGAFASFNLGAHTGDDSTAVHENRVRLRDAAALPADPVWLKQVHGTNVVDAAAVVPGTAADGAYSRRKRVVCAVLTADCLPVFVCNRQGTEVGLLHAGWRGLAAGIIEAGLRALRSPPGQLLVWLGPAISVKAYEVGDDVRTAFISRDPRAAEAFTAGTAGKWSMDLYRLARQRLAAQGVCSIYGGEYCTATQPDLFYSHRRDGVTGRMASLIWRQ